MSQQQNQPSEPLSGEGAADFLGLSDELGLSSEAQDSTSPPAWLVQVEEGHQQPLLTPELDAVEEQAVATQPLAPASAAPTKTVQRAARSSRRWLLSAAFGVLALGTAAYYANEQGWLSSAPAVEPLVTPVSKPAPKTEPSAVAQPSTAQPTPDETPKPSAPTVSNSESTALVENSAAQQPSIEPETKPIEPVAQVVVIPTPVRESEPTAAPERVMGNGARRSQPSDYSKLYMGSEIPRQEVYGATRLSTPSVGGVRAVLKNGEQFMGPLHSVGEGRVWIDVAMGRMSFEASELASLQKLPELPAGTKPLTAQEQAIAGLPLVLVRTPGGMIEGWLVNRTEDQVTLVTRQAERLTIESRQVEPLTSVRSRVVSLRPTAQ